jgi:hypothetical protein
LGSARRHRHGDGLRERGAGGVWLSGDNALIRWQIPKLGWWEVVLYAMSLGGAAWIYWLVRG